MHDASKYESERNFQNLFKISVVTVENKSDFHQVKTSSLYEFYCNNMKVFEG